MALTGIDAKHYAKIRSLWAQVLKNLYIDDEFEDYNQESERNSDSQKIRAMIRIYKKRIRNSEESKHDNTNFNQEDFEKLGKILKHLYDIENSVTFQEDLLYNYKVLNVLNKKIQKKVGGQQCYWHDMKLIANHFEQEVKGTDNCTDLIQLIRQKIISDFTSPRLTLDELGQILINIVQTTQNLDDQSFIIFVNQVTNLNVMELLALIRKLLGNIKLNQKLQQMQKYKDQCEQQAQQLKECQEQERKIQDYEEQTQKLKTQLQQLETDQKKEINNFTQNLQELQANCASQDYQNKTLQEEITKLQRQQLENKQQFINKDTIIASMERENNTLADENQILKQSLQAFEKDQECNVVLQQENQRLKQQLETTKKKEKERFTNFFSKSNEEKDKLYTQITDLKQELDKMKQQLVHKQNVSEQYRKHKRLHDIAKKEIKDLKLEIKDQKNVIKEKTKTIQSLSNQNTEIRRYFKQRINKYQDTSVFPAVALTFVQLGKQYAGERKLTPYDYKIYNNVLLTIANQSDLDQKSKNDLRRRFKAHLIEKASLLFENPEEAIEEIREWYEPAEESKTL